ncbi:MAG: M48 family metallopeptidase, partial [Marinobacter sp.]|nr:M48 family metallopeptidase [Marinobacter sp.]
PTPSTKPAPESGQPHANPETEMLTTDQLESQFAEPIPRLPVSWTYKLGLMGVMVMSLIAPVIYFSLVLAVSAGLVWYLILLPGLLAKTHGAMATLFTVTFIPFICSVFLLFLARPLFIRFPPPRSLALERRKNRQLFQLVDLMCERMGLPPVQEIRVDNEVNASMGPSKGLASLLQRKLTLTLGMPLVAGMTSRQLIGVIGHELGHFAQPVAMVSNYLINNVNFWMANRAFAEDPWDTRLANWHQKSPFAAINVMLWLTQMMIRLTRYLFKGMYYFNLWISRHMSRQMEYDADRYECWIAGSDAFAGTAERLHTLGFAGQHAHNINRRAWDDGKLLEDMPAAITQVADDFSDQDRSAIREHMEVRQTSVWDTHPADNDRVQHAESHRYPGSFRIDAPARALMPNFEALCRIVTIRDYTGFGIQDPKPYLAANHQVMAVSNARNAADNALDTYFNGAATKRFMQLDESLMEGLSLQEVVDEIRRKLPELSMLHDQFFKLLQRHSNQVYGLSYLEAGIAINPASFELPANDIRQVRDALANTRQEIERYRKNLKAIDRLFGQRMLLAIDAMPGETASQARKLFDSLRHFDQLTPACRITNAYSNVIHVILSDQDEESRKQIEPALAPVTSRCQEGLAQFLQLARQVPIALPAEPDTLLACAAQKELLGSDDVDAFGTLKAAPATILQASDHYADLADYCYYRTLAELARLCESQEKAMGIQPLRLVKVEPSKSAA